MTCLDNVRRVLGELGLTGLVTVTLSDEDRVWAWPVGDGLMRHVVLHNWRMDIPEVAASMHGTGISFREPGGVNPALQVCFHRAPSGHLAAYFIELDLDLHAPDWRHPLGLLQHGVEVLKNRVTGAKTNQRKVSAALDRRFKRNANS